MAHGGKRPGAGRPKGAKSKATVEAKATLAELAKQYTNEAIETLVSLMRGAESDSARLAAANAILDRAYGKPAQAIQHSGEDGGAIIFKMVL